MNILLMGPQGSGKGTQARLLIEKYGFYYFESGAYLRRIAQDNPDLKEYLDKGALVPDKEMTSYLCAFLDSENLYDDVIFDGFPRTIDQYNFWKKWLDERKIKIDLVIDLEISEEESIRRVEARRVDPKTGKIYNLITEKPPNGVDIDKLVQRDDDKPQAIKKRLSLYKERTEPLIEELKKTAKLVTIDGSLSVDKIQRQIDKELEAVKNG